MRVALITALPPTGGGCGEGSIPSPNVSRQTSSRRGAKTLKIRVNAAEVNANFAFRPDSARDLRYSPPILKGRILR